jgi:glycosyltransferase involved in cell wall biosynthesis
MASESHESFAVTQSPYRDYPESVQKEHYTIFHLEGNLLEARKWEFYALPEDEREAAAEKLFMSNDIIQNVDILTDQLEGLIRKIQPDIIHAHSTYVIFNRVLSRLKSNSRLKIPAIITVHGFPKPLILPDGKETTDFEELFSAFSFDLCIAVSEKVAEYIRKHLEPKFHDRVRTIYSGIDLSPEITMLMTGEGSLKDKLFEEFDERGVSPMVDYQGVVEVEEVPVLINKSRIFLYPSRREPFGLSIVEAMACGVPVITTNVFGPKEIVRDDYDGIAVPPDDVKALVDAVETLLSDKKLRKRVAQNALKSVAERYDIREHARDLVTIYQETIDRQQK